MLSPQLINFFLKAKSAEEAERGLLFMQEMIELSKTNSIPTSDLHVNLQMTRSLTVVNQNFYLYFQAVSYTNPETNFEVVLSAGPSHFSPDIVNSVTSKTAFVEPFQACDDVQNAEQLNDKIAIIERGECTFVDKARRAMQAGAKAVIIFDNVPDTSITNQPPFAMSGDGKDDVRIPTCFLFTNEAIQLRNALNIKSDLEVTKLFISSNL